MATNLRPLCVLVVEDRDEVDPESLSYLVRGWGHRTCSARDRKDALGLTGTLRPDVVVLDVGVSGGWELAHALAVEPGTGHALLIAVTESGLKGRKRAALAGYHMRLVRPIDTRVFKFVLRRKQQMQLSPDPLCN